MLDFSLVNLKIFSWKEKESATVFVFSFLFLTAFCPHWNSKGQCDDWQDSKKRGRKDTLKGDQNYSI